MDIVIQRHRLIVALLVFLMFQSTGVYAGRDTTKTYFQPIQDNTELNHWEWEV